MKHLNFMLLMPYLKVEYTKVQCSESQKLHIVKKTKRKRGR